MIAVESKLKLISSDIFQSDISYKPKSDLSQRETIIKMRDLPVDIDFDIKTNKDGSLFVFSNVQINAHNDADFGYSIFVAGITVFTFAEGTDEDEKKSLIGSAVNISITNLRNYISNATSYYPLGSFSFHSIDMKALFEAKAGEKKEQQKKNGPVDQEFFDDEYKN
ncbi:MAG TPA: hypothetical protein GXX42_14770 [Petrimonas sp.]|uniref:hypothetical protein n=1 Tax=Petrimonas sp. TaxID=2023866 RepID=UPI00095A8E76|nr:MAG: hypothetical protein BGO33_07715 [Bacteroidia bacterium 43-41]HHV87048.1 hypothetical protein [Petrimonas sp.]